MGVALLGTVAASLASLFRSQDVAEGDDEADSATADAVTAVPVTEESVVVSELRSLRAEVAALRDELRRRDTK